MHQLVESVKSFLDAHGIDGPGVVAVSGGADSVALLRALVTLSKPVTVAHVNHQLRGRESDEDEAFVRGLAANLQVPCVSERIGIPPGQNLEATARQQRYEWLGSLGAEWIATAHTANDQAETVLHRIIRGTGLQGLIGIHAIRCLTPGTASASTAGPTARSSRIVRPLLRSSRADVLDYLGTLDQSYRIDSSNSDLTLTRNRIRHEIIPVLRQFNPEIVPALSLLSEQAADVFQYIQEVQTGWRARVLLPRAGATLILVRESLLQMPELLRRELLRALWQEEGWPLASMTHAHWHRLANLAPGDYPGQIRLTLTDRVVQLGPAK